MTQHLIIICITTILLWYYYIKSKEQDDKYLPVMMRQSELLHENAKLKQENKKLKLKLKYLENYKNDVSKTFKILDNELGLINEHIKTKTGTTTEQSEQNSSVPNTNIPNSNSFRTSLTPNVLTSLIRSSQETTPTDSMFNGIFNRFLTGDMQFMNPINIPEGLAVRRTPLQRASQQQTQPPAQRPPQQQQQLVPNDIVNDPGTVNENNTYNETVNQPDTINETDTVNQNEPVNEESGVPQNSTQEGEQSQATLSFSVNYLPLNSEYRQYLIRHESQNN